MLMSVFLKKRDSQQGSRKRASGSTDVKSKQVRHTLTLGMNLQRLSAQVLTKRIICGTDAASRYPSPRRTSDAG